jgi:hypothetical protein
MFPIALLPPVVPAGAPQECLTFLFIDPEHHRTMVSEIKAGRLFVGIRGFVKYKDVFDRDRETRFRYVWKYFKESIGEDAGDWEKCGATEDNQDT